MFGNMVQPDLECIRELGPIIDRAFAYWEHHRHLRHHDVTESSLEYLTKKAKVFTTAKIERYHKNIVKFYNDSRQEDLIGSYLAMNKTGEQYLTTQTLVDG